MPVNTAPSIHTPHPHLHLLAPEDRAGAIVEALDRQLEIPSAPTWERPVEAMLDRGVWVAPWRDMHGNPIIVAISGDHRVLSWLPWLASQPYEDVTAQLWRILNGADPIA